MAALGAYGIKAAAAGAGLGPLEIAAGAGALARRGKMMFFSIGCSDAPADHTITFQIQRKTATGTGGAVTLAVIDSGDVIADIGAAALQTMTITATITANTILMKRSFNTKYGYDFFPPPGGEIMYPATPANGIVVDTPIAANADNLTAYLQIMEL